MPSYVVRDPNTGKRYKVRQGGQPTQAEQVPPAPLTRQQLVQQKMQQMEESPLNSLTSGATSVMTLGLSDLLTKGFGLKPPENSYRTAGQVATIAGGVAPSILKGVSHVAKGVPYTKLFKGGQRFAEGLSKSKATVNLADEAETLARARGGPGIPSVNPALRKQTLSKAEQAYGNLTGKVPVEDLLNARGQVPVSTAHDVANLTSQNLAKSYFEKWGQAMRGGNELEQLGLKSSINRKIIASDPALKQLYKNYATGRGIDEFVSNLNPLGIPLKVLRALKRVR